MKSNHWPVLDYAKNKETYQTMHMWSQILGKTMLNKKPWINHSWHIALIVTPYGLSTGTLSSEDKYFQIDLDFLKHQLKIRTSENEEHTLDLRSLSVADCYHGVIRTLGTLGIDVEIHPVPSELPDPPLFTEDHRKTYNPESATSLHHALLKAHDVFTVFRSRFIGKSSPSHFFWGSFDLAVSRFSGREAPEHPAGIPNMPDWVAKEAYSHEVFSSGFWPGNDQFPEAAFYTYIYPEPDGFKDSRIIPDKAYYLKEMGEFILPYKAVQQSDNPTGYLMKFLESSYNAAADLAGWNRKNLEKPN